MWRCAVFLVCSLVVVACGEDWRIVNIDQGPVRGYLHPDRTYYSFFNIPYATAPTGTDRFKAPLPAPVFLSTFDAVNRNIICPQPFGTLQMQEDCLVANVFVPNAEATNLPVLVVVHGGAYQLGHGLAENFQNFVREKHLILVTFNYRLGVHGFLCLGTEGAPGNAGLKDQVALLRWVNRNIASFGGNPDDVTLAGCSAGSGSVDFLTISSLTQGLFKKAILESGISTGATGTQIDAIQNAKDYAKVLNFNDVDDLDKLEEFYRTASFQLLASRVDQIINNPDVTTRFAPCVERDIGQERVIMDSPMNIKTGGNYTKVPLLYGFTNMEGAMRLPSFDDWKVRMNDKFSDFLPAELHFESEEVKEEVAQKVKQFYFGNDPVSEENIVSYILYFTDVLFSYPMLRSLSSRVEALGDTIYLFEYSFVDEDTPSFPHTQVRGADHCHQFVAVMDHDVSHRTDEFKRMQHLLREYWISFIKNGSPSSSNLSLPTWVPANSARSPHLSLGPVLQLKDDILEGRADFWDPIYDEYYRGPVIPSPEPESEPTTDGAVTQMISNILYVAVILTIYLAL
nr:juvenile hormone esterase [Helicoverpa armigera]WRX06135.1 CCE001x [Helicoverpa armigera]